MPKATNNNMELWNRVSKTNPDYTKHVNIRGGFTAIDPHSQIQSATEAFGPAGIAWGWEILRVEYLPTGHVAQLIGLWHSTEEKPGVQQWGQASMYVGNNSDRPDVDCMKKATTDGLTKCLSYLGFNADVFLGKFDDVKYVENVANEFKQKTDNACAGKATIIIKNIKKTKTVDDLKKMKENITPEFKMINADSPAQGNRIKQTLQAQMEKLKEGAAS